MSIDGFNYATQTPLSLDREAWEARVADVLAHGGHRRVEHGETFVHDLHGALILEIYSNIRNRLHDVSDLL